MDLLTATVPYVAIVPDFWVQEGRCSYPKSRGEVAAMRRDIPNDKWLVYDCIVRKQFGNASDISDSTLELCPLIITIRSFTQIRIKQPRKKRFELVSKAT